MKDHISIQATNLQSEAEKFILRWESTIEELETNENNINLTIFKERQENWKLLQDKQIKLFEDAKKLQIEISNDILELFDDIQSKVSKQSKQWQIFDEFTIELENIINEEWAVYRKRPYIFTEFLLKWENSIKSSLDAASLRIRKIIERYQSVLSILQFLQSDALTDRHWARLFQIFNKKPKPAYTILLKDILEDTNILLSNSNEIQV